MTGGATKSIVQVEMAEGLVQIIIPEAADHALAKPHAFGVAGRPAQAPFGFCVFVDLLVRILAVVGGWSALIARLWLGALGKKRRPGDHNRGTDKRGTANTQTRQAHGISEGTGQAHGISEGVGPFPAGCPECHQTSVGLAAQAPDLLVKLMGALAAAVAISPCA
jgi:hypothetical protein